MKKDDIASWDTPTPEQVRADIEATLENDPGMRSIIFPAFASPMLLSEPLGLGQHVKGRLRRGSKIKMSYRGCTHRFGAALISLRITFVLTGAQGIMYVSPDALPHKYGME